MFQGKTAVLTGVAAALLAFLPTAGKAHTTLPAYIVEPFATQQCAAGNVSICGQIVPMPDVAMGASVTMSVPSPYVHQPFAVQCTPAGYQIIDASAVTCTPLSCTTSSVPLCGTSISVPGGTLIGRSTTVPVPSMLLADPSSSPELSFTAQCVDDGQGGVMYQVAGNQNISCNMFPCPDSQIRLCENLIPIAGGTPLGGVLHLFMPPPFMPDPFTVGCIGSGGNPPVYQLMDGSAVTCGIMPQGQ